MRNLIFGLLSVVSVASISACGGDDDKKVTIPDLSMKASADLTTVAVITGCNGFAACLQACPDDPNNPGFYDPTCVTACENNATDNALNLYFQATLGCAGQALCTSTPDGGGAIPCMSTDLDGSGNPSDACQACIDAAYMNNQAGVMKACKTAAAACTADKP